MKKFDAPKHFTATSKRLWKRIRADYVIDDAPGLQLLQALCESRD